MSLRDDLHASLRATPRKLSIEDAASAKLAGELMRRVDAGDRTARRIVLAAAKAIKKKPYYIGPRGKLE